LATLLFLKEFPHINKRGRWGPGEHPSDKVLSVTVYTHVLVEVCMNLKKIKVGGSAYKRTLLKRNTKYGTNSDFSQTFLICGPYM
jgi:hypothetical protein